MTMLTKLDLDFKEEWMCEECPYYLPSYRDPKATLTQACWILDSNPNLVDLTMRAVLLKDRRDALLLTTTLYRLRRLRALNLEFALWKTATESLIPKVVIDIFFACPPSLRKLILASHFQNGYSQSRTFSIEYNEFEPGTLQSWEKPDADCGLATTTTMTMPRRHEPLLDLKELHLGGLGNFSGDELQSTLHHCPNLTTLHLPGLHDIDDIPRFGGEIARWCPKLSDLANNGFRSGDEELKKLLVWILRALPLQQATRFVLNGLPSATIEGLDDAGSIFKGHSRTLREISLHGYMNVDSKVVQTILVQCEALESLKVHCPRGSDRYQVCLVLEDATEFPWACTRMQDLRLTIIIPDKPLHRPADGLLPYYDRPPPTTLSAEERQQFKDLESFYRQLGKLTQLRRLELRALYSDPTGMRKSSWVFPANSFPGMLSLRNEGTGRPGYLQLLGGLTKLKTLIGSVAAYTKETMVTIGMDEVVWMDKHWPALEKAGFFRVLPTAPSPFNWLLKQRQMRGPDLDICALY
ncbi:MAG: hypothetical protein JOS17DRAFT_760739 [Linnemannia elongata]|nr:MAG: hypothetical protein JOS17DRAFT_760739 [Linnemannia elongata]